jgi:predicted tellurium resistance membrane protein TerC
MEGFDALLTSAGLISLLTLTGMEIVLGIDNIIFISIVTGKLPKENQRKARLIGLSLALIMRILLLMSITWIIGLSEPILSVADYDMSIRDLILFLGGLFLIAKTVSEMHAKLEGKEEEHQTKSMKSQVFSMIILQIVLIDIVFSIDSILTAIGLAQEVLIMIIAVIISMIIMLLFAKSISDFVHKHPTVKMLALAFMVMIGTLLVVEAFHVHVPKGYIYFSMAFSLIVEMLNLRLRKKAEPVDLRNDELQH